MYSDKTLRDDFMVRFGNSSYGYGRSTTFDQWRYTEFSHTRGITFLDHASSTLYSQSQLDNYHEDLSNNFYSNPHSGHQTSKLTTDIIDSMRHRVLEFLGTNEDNYDVIFTSNATHSLNLIASSFPWRRPCGREASDHGPDLEDLSICPETVETLGETDRSVFCYLDDDHTSVIGMRELAAKSGARIICVSEKDICNNREKKYREADRNFQQENGKNCEDTLHLFAYPAQSNFSGRRYPREWVSGIKTGKLRLNRRCPGDWKVLLDATSFLSTACLNLSENVRDQPDFVVMSFYKIFGFPTGLGALLVHRDCWGVMEKSYFGGGTVAATISWKRFHQRKSKLHDSFEDGTLPFLGILALKYGFDTLQSLTGGMSYVSAHTSCLAQFTHERMRGLMYPDGTPVLDIYIDRIDEDHIDWALAQGPIIAFNVLKQGGGYVGFSQVQKLAAGYNIEMRAGCFCNTGACQKHVGLSSEQLIHNLQSGHECGDDVDLIDGVPTGALRISFGYMSNFDDCCRFVSFLDECFASCTSTYCTRTTLDEMTTTIKRTLTEIALYPVKSCAAQKVNQWKLCQSGLQYDRNWMIVSDAGVCLSQKQEPRLCLIRPVVEAHDGSLTLFAEGVDPVKIPHVEGDDTSLNFTMNHSFKICSDRVLGDYCGLEATDWLTVFLGYRAHLIHQPTSNLRTAKRDISSKISLANEAQFLMVSSASASQLCQHMRSITNEDYVTDNIVARFRGNFVICGFAEFVEEGWSEVKIGEHVFQCVGKCTRCQMICVDQSDATRQKQTLLALNDIRGKMAFGVYLMHNAAQSYSTASINVGDIVTPM